MPLVAIAAITAGAGLASGAIGAHAAGKAADAQSQAAMYAADKQKEAADQSLAFQKDEWNTQQQNLAPWLSAGKTALGDLTAGLRDGGKFASTPTFTAPTGLTEQNDPGYQARLALGQQALERSAAARGNVLGLGTAKALSRYGQDYASNEYGNVYSRAMNQYQTELTNQNTLYNRYAGVAGTGQMAASTLGDEGSRAATNVSNTLMTSAAQQGQDYQNAANARASGYMNSANAWVSGLGTATNAITGAMMLHRQQS